MKFNIEFLNKREGKFIRQISNQKFNDYKKLVSKTAGVTNVVEGRKMKIFHRKIVGTHFSPQ